MPKYFILYLSLHKLSRVDLISRDKLDDVRTCPYKDNQFYTIIDKKIFNKISFIKDKIIIFAKNFFYKR